MRLILYTLLGLACVAVAAITFLVVAAPTGLIREQAIAMVRQQTGRELSIGGPVSLSLYPNLAVTLDDVALANPPQMGGEPFVEMEQLRLQVPVMPLLQREVRVERFVLVKPRFALRATSDGRNNWTFARGSDADRSVRFAALDRQAGLGAGLRTAQGAVASDVPPEAFERLAQAQRAAGTANDAGGAGNSGGALGGQLRGLSLGDVQIVGGSLVYSNEADGSTQRLDDIDVALSLARIDGPLGAEGKARWRGENVPFELEIASLADLIEGQATKLRAEMRARPVAALYEGQIRQAARLTLDGQLALQAVSLGELGRWVDVALADAPGFGAGRISGRLQVNGDRVTLRSATFEAGPNRGEGTIVANLVGKVPAIETELRFALLDLDSFRGGSAGTSTAQPASGASDGGAGGGASGSGDGIGDLLRQLGTGSGAKQFVAGGVSQSAKPSAVGANGWSREAIDLGTMRLVAVRARVRADELRVANLVVGPAQLSAQLKGGQLETVIEDVALYGGRGKGTVGVDARRNVPQFAAKLELTGVQMLGLLRDLAEFQRVDARGRVVLDLAAKGASEHAMVASLTGPIRIELSDGAIVGVNVAKALRNLQQGRIGDIAQGDDERTDFTALDATFVAAAGVLTNDDLNLVGPLVRVDGAGTISLPKRTLDYLVRPRLVASLQGQGGGAAKGIEIPVRVQGPWDRPNYVPDLSGLLADPEGAVRAVEGLTGNLANRDEVRRGIEELRKGGDAGRLLRGLLGSQ
ncbi:MAG: AsmA family protein [Rhizobiales bacterium]|nr:AsmA family protein [Hyphomicrobiales bacterium]